jgi:hypothetical protein
VERGEETKLRKIKENTIIKEAREKTVKHCCSLSFL